MVAWQAPWVCLLASTGYVFAYLLGHMSFKHILLYIYIYIIHTYLDILYLSFYMFSASFPADHILHYQTGQALYVPAQPGPSAQPASRAPAPPVQATLVEEPSKPGPTAAQQATQVAGAAMDLGKAGLKILGTLEQLHLAFWGDNGAL